MKRLTAVLLALLLMLLPMAHAEGAALRVTNCSEWVSLRRAPDTDASRIATVPLNAAVTDCFFAGNGFIACSYKGLTGYILAEYLTPYSGALTAAAMRVTNCESWVSLRAGASTNANRLAKAALGAIVTDCTYVGDGFVRCTYQGIEGYILLEYLSVSESVYEKPQQSSAGGASIHAIGAGSEGQIHGCDSWVSLRAEPSSKAERLAKVPLGAIITDCKAWDGAFTRCRYNGVEGYILTAYISDPGSVLFSAADLNRFGRICTNETLGEYTLMAARSYGETEILRISVFDAAMRPIWSCATGSGEIGMLDATAAFMAGTAASPAVAVYNCNPSLSYSLDCDVLTLYDLASGRIRWSLNSYESGLYGGGICHVVDKLGNMYIGGYLGPDPVCISANGRLLWTSSANDDDIFWLYDIQLTGSGLVAYYESGIDGEMAGDNVWAVYYSIDPAALADDPFITPSRVELKYN